MNERKEYSLNNNFFSSSAWLSESSDKKPLPGQLLQKYRHRAKLSQAQLASLLDLRSRRMVQSWESNDNLPLPERLQKLIELYVKKKVFTPERQYQEALAIWEAVKNYSDAKSRKLSIYPIFDVEWFESLVRNLKEPAASPSLNLGAELSLTSTNEISESKRPIRQNISQHSITNQAETGALATDSLAVVPTGVNSSLATTMTGYLNLPVAEPDLIGRQQEIRDMATLLLTNPYTRLVTLTGLGGVGKTTLAMHIASKFGSSNRFTDGVIWISLVTVRYPEQLLDAIANGLNIEISHNKIDQLKTICTWLYDKQILLILDNFEQIVEARGVVAELLKFTSKLKILITSRCGLDLPMEQQYRVSPLASPATVCGLHGSLNTQYLEEIARASAVELFVKRAKLSNMSFELTADNAVLIARICERLEGLPLTIEIATSRLKLFSLTEMLQRLESPLSFLGSKQSDFNTHQRTLYSTLGWSYSLLAKPEQQLFRSFGLFLAGSSLAMLEWLTRRLYSEGTLEPIYALVNHNLLVRQEKETSIDSLAINPSNLSGNTKPKYSEESLLTVLTESRFRMLEIVREFALEQLLTLPEEFEQVVLLLLEYYLELFPQAEQGLRGNDQIQWLEWFDLEYPNVQLLLDRLPFIAVTKNQSEIHLRRLKLATLLRHFWLRKCLFEEGCRYLSQLLTESREQLQSPTLGLTSVIAASGQCREVTATRNEKEFISSCAPELHHINALEALAILTIKQGKLAEALEYLTECELFYLERGHTTRLVNTRNTKGVIKKKQGKLIEAKTLYEEALSGFIELADTAGAERTLTNLGNLERQLGNYQMAIGYYKKILSATKVKKDLFGTINLLNSLGLTLIEHGDYDLAKKYLEEALQLNLQTPQKCDYSEVINNLGLVAFYQNDYGKALQYYNESLALDRQSGSRDGIVNSLLNLAQLQIAQNRLTEARQYLEESADLVYELDSKNILAEYLYYLNIVTIKQMWNKQLDWQAAHMKTSKDEIITSLRQLIELQVEVGNKKDIALSRSAVAKFMILEKEWKKAVLIFSFVTKSLHEIGRKNADSDWKQEYAADLLLLKNKLSSDDFDIAWEAGQVASQELLDSLL